MINYIKIVFLAVTLQKASSEEASWSYQDSERWGDLWPTCAKGQYQSPINLEHNAIGFDNSRPPVEIFYHDTQPQEITICNNGYYVVLSGTWQGNAPYITGSIIFEEEIYKFDNFNVHWSTANNNGTEHSIKGKKYAAELHMAYINNKYRNLNEAVKNPDGIAMLSILFYVNDSVSPNPGMKDYTSLLGSVQNPGDLYVVSSFNLSAFIPNSVISWYSYHGSLSAPPCSENVRWVVITEPQPINTQIMEAVRSVKLKNNNSHNLRPLQATNNRLVELYGQ